MTIRADLITKRTYCREKEDGSFETWEEVVARVITHQEWLWKRAAKGKLTKANKEELEKLRTLMLSRKGTLSGRSLWLGGTDLAKRRESSLYNCSFTKVETVYDVVDAFWLLLQGCGVGFKPIRGTLNGFFKPLKSIKIIPSTRTINDGATKNKEIISKRDKTWTLIVGDSAESWAKVVGKLLAGKHDIEHLILDFSEIRPAGKRLKGYGWLCSGYEPFAKALESIALLLSKKSGCLLSAIDILDIINHLGTVLSSRRSAQICLLDVEDIEAKNFATIKKDYWLTENYQRAQSNNSLLFWEKPSREKLEELFTLMIDSGGSEPAFINGEAASKRATWFSGVNPCAEILLSSKSFCNLAEVDLAKYGNNPEELYEALTILARACYRQTLVNLKDGILQESWHLNNEFLRLCGVGLTGIAQRPELTAYDYKMMERVTTSAAFSMADELGLQRPKNVTCVKPSGTLSKIMDTTEGVHKPLGKYIFNNIIFSNHDESLPLLREANYHVFPHPFDKTSSIVTFPICWENINFTKVESELGTVEVNLESAISQLERYKLLQLNWTQQNTSVTISYDKEEVPAIITWLLDNWENYVGVSFIFRTDPSKSAKELGYAYLPQEVVTKERYEEYISKLLPIELSASYKEISSEECSSGACPIK